MIPTSEGHMSANVKVVEGDVEMSRDRSSLPTSEAIDCPQNSEISSKIAGKALEESVDQNSSLTKEHTRGIVDVLPSEPPDKSFEASDKLEPEEDAHRYNGGTIRMTAHEAGGAKKRNRPKQKIVVSSLQVSPSITYPLVLQVQHHVFSILDGCD